MINEVIEKYLKENETGFTRIDEEGNYINYVSVARKYNNPVITAIMMSCAASKEDIKQERMLFSMLKSYKNDKD